MLGKNFGHVVMQMRAVGSVNVLKSCCVVNQLCTLIPDADQALISLNTNVPCELLMSFRNMYILITWPSSLFGLYAK